MSTKTIKTNVQVDTLARWKKEAELIGTFTELAMQRRIIRSCINCDHFREKEGEICTRFPGYEVRPPARVITLGCNSWEEEIPF